LQAQCERCAWSAVPATSDVLSVTVVARELAAHLASAHQASLDEAAAKAEAWAFAALREARD